MKLALVAKTFLLALILTSSAFAVDGAGSTGGGGCGESMNLPWHPVEESTAPITMAQAIVQLRRTHNVIITPFHLITSCGVHDHIVTDAEDNAEIGRVPVPDGTDDGRYLLVRVPQLLQEKDKMKRLAAAYNTWDSDRYSIAARLGFSLSMPMLSEDRTQIVISIAIPVVQRDPVYNSIMFDSGAVVARLIHLPRPFTEIPGRTSYEAADLYQAGDFQRALFSDVEFWRIYRATMENSLRIGLSNDRWHNVEKMLDQTMSRTTYELFPMAEIALNPMERAQRAINAGLTNARLVNGDKLELTQRDGKVVFIWASFPEALLAEQIVNRSGTAVERYTLPGDERHMRELREYGILKDPLPFAAP